jgi:integrase
MMVHRTRGDRGHLQIDIVLPGFGRFRMSAGTPRATVLHRRKALAKRLDENGQLDTLRALKARTLSWAKVEEAAKKGRLENAALLSDLRIETNLWTAIEQTMPKLGKRSAATRRWYRSQLDQLKVLGFGDDARVSDLRIDDWPARMAAWDVSPSTKNGLRRAVSRFLSRYLGSKLHLFRAAVLDEEAWPLLKVRKRVRGVPEFLPFLQAIPERGRPAVIVLAATGMRIGEFLNDDGLELDAAHFMIYPDGKTGPKEYAIAPELWPMVTLALPCRLARMKGKPTRIQNDARYKLLYRWVRAAGVAIGEPVTVHDLRRLFARLGVAGTNESKTQDAIGHETGHLTRDYARWHTKQEVAAAVAKALGVSGGKSGDRKRHPRTPRNTRRRTA